jgi:hypothetical protein
VSILAGRSAQICISVVLTDLMSWRVAPFGQVHSRADPSKFKRIRRRVHLDGLMIPAPILMKVDLPRRGVSHWLSVRWDLAQGKPAKVHAALRHALAWKVPRHHSTNNPRPILRDRRGCLGRLVRGHADGCRSKDPRNQTAIINFRQDDCVSNLPALYATSCAVLRVAPGFMSYCRA